MVLEVTGGCLSAYIQVESEIMSESNAELTQQEAQQMSSAMENAEFRQLLADHVDQMRDPINRKVSLTLNSTPENLYSTSTAIRG